MQCFFLSRLDSGNNPPVDIPCTRQGLYHCFSDTYCNLIELTIQVFLHLLKLFLNAGVNKLFQVHLIIAS